MRIKKRRNTFSRALTRRGRRSFSVRKFTPYEVKPLNDITGWVGLNKENSFGAFKELLACANSEILMSFYQIKINEKYKTTLVNRLVEIIYNRVLNGVSAKIILNDNFYIPSLRKVTHTAFKRLKDIGSEVRLYHKNKMLHSKLIIVDKKILYIGSQNLTNTGIASNSESGIILNSKDISCFFREYFYRMWVELEIP